MALFFVYVQKVIEIVQEDADGLWFSCEPILSNTVDANGDVSKNEKRIRGWVAAGTAIGPRHLGGLNTMSWKDHVDNFLTLLVVQKPPISYNSKTS